MRLKEFIRELTRVQKNLKHDPIVTFTNNCIANGTVYAKEHSDLFLGDLTVEDSPIGKFIGLKKSQDGKYLVIDTNESEIFTPDDFQK